MESTTRIAILFIRRNPVPISIHLPRDAFVVLDIVAKIVLIYEVMARVVGWIDIDHLDPAMIALLQELQDLEIISLDVKILGRIPDLALFLAWAECPRRRCLREAQGLSLAVPSEAVALILVVHIVPQNLAQNIEIDLPLLERLGKELPHGRKIFFGNVQ